MSVESYGSLDESSLRALLDGTMDLDERRLIRSAIRELRRKEIQSMEEALASKRFRSTRAPAQEDKERFRSTRTPAQEDKERFRSTRTPAQEDKENQQKNQEKQKTGGSDALDLLSHKLQNIRDIEELTRMLRAAAEYEERKMIRAVIRQRREEQPEAVETVRASESRSEDTSQEPRSTRAKDEPERREDHSHNTGMVLVFDPLLKDEGPQPLLIQAPGDEPLPSPRLRTDSGSSASSAHSCSTQDSVEPCYRSRLGSGASDRSQGPTQRIRLDSGASDRSQGPTQRSRLGSGASDRSQGPTQRSRLGSGASDRSQGPTQRIRLDSGASDRSQGPTQRIRRDSEASERSVSVCSEDREPVLNGFAHSTDSETETRGHSLKAPTQDQADGALFSKPGPKNGLKNGLSNGSLKGRSDFLNQKITFNNSLSNGKPKDAVLEQFSRTNSIRDRMRKFTESTQTHSAPHRQTPTDRTVLGSRAGPSQRANQSSTRTDHRKEPSDVHSESSGGGTESGHTEEPVGGTGPAAESSGPVGGTGTAAEKDGVSRVSEIPAEEQSPGTEQEPDMKTFLTIEIKDGRSGGPSGTAGPQSNAMGAPRITATNALGQRTELTLGLRATPFKISSSTFSSAPSVTMETEPIVASEPVFSAPPSVIMGCPAPDLPNGSSSQSKPEDRPGKLTPEQLEKIEDEELLDKMLDECKDFEERRLIRAAMRDLRKRKRDQREKERENRLQELRQQREQKSRAAGGAGGPGTLTGAPGGTGEVLIRKLEKSADGNTLSQVTKTDRFAQSDDGSRSTRSTLVETSFVQKTDRGTVQSTSYSFSSSSSMSSNSTKKVGSVFERTDDSSSRSGASASAERRQAERRKELMRAQTMPKASSMQARKAMIEKLDKDSSGGSGGPAAVKINRVQRSTSFGVPNANSIKQMLLDWCRAKTRSYEHVDIQNFSSSWSNGMAFCALVHHFFPEAFDYSSLSPSERRHNFDLAFSTAERMVDCPQLLDVDDMVKMREPDWKCVYTYLQEFYRGLVTKGLVKTRGNS